MTMKLVCDDFTNRAMSCAGRLPAEPQVPGKNTHPLGRGTQGLSLYFWSI